MVSDLPSLRGISTGKRSSGVRWDEANLEANEDIKRDLNPTKITEPKTPYRSPLETDDELDIHGSGIAPLRLDEDLEAAGPPSLQRRSPHRTAPAPAPILVHRSPEHAGGSDSERHARSPGLCGRSPRFSGDTDWAEHEADSPDPDHQLKRQKFLEARRKHYNLKMSLREAHDLVDEDEKEGPAQEGANGGTADAKPGE
ncbi:hypothetical protein QBZ16_001298 [Prototheca wickerhamii]|uniref:Protein phosphatase inhibitor 2 (IPP-2) n=1 Tax=Prototheca wickerhamii TaxID=3111 RepID=A0AAD9MGX4_PROWI|nr:hypothetical protein QBZ16_001298 [Prototheca wickerhamii]